MISKPFFLAGRPTAGTVCVRPENTSPAPFRRDARPPRRWSRLLCGLVGALAFCSQSSFALDPTKTIFQYNLQNWTRQEGLPSDKVTDITQTPDGYLWLGTQNGLVRFNGLDFKRVSVSTLQAGGQEIVSMTASKNGGLWLAINGGQFCYFDGRGFSVVSGP